MKWFQKTLAIIAMINMVFSPAWAVDWTTQDKAKVAQYRDYLEPLGYNLTLDPEAKKALVFDKNTQKLTMEIPFSDETQLRKFSPKSLNQMMMDEMVRVKSASKAAWSHSVKNIPTEAAIFFMAMGAVVAGQLITNYSQNPVAMKQHIEHSLSPLGVFGFFIFMYSQGVTSNVLSMYMKNPKFHHMIPYLGMTVGAFLQTYLSQIASDPNVKACAKTMLGQQITEKERAAGIDEDPCSKAYEYLVIHKKIWEFAPGIVSMLISAGLAGFAQSVVAKTVLKITGVDIALWLVPGTMQLKGVRLLLVKGLQISAFVAIDMWLNRKVVFAWKNIFDGAEFKDINANLVTHVNSMKRNQWAGSDTELQSELKNFHNKMVNWRMMNLSEVYEAHQNWSEALQQLTSMYNSSFAFYNTFVSELRNSRYQESDIGLLERSYPYVGIKAKGLSEGKEDLYFTNPQFIESMQEETIADAVTQIRTLLARGGDKNLFPGEKKEVAILLNKLGSGERLKIAEGLKELSKSVEVSLRNVSTSLGYRNLMQKIYGLIGRPNPMMEIGRGYLATYEQAPFSGEALQGTNYYRQVGAFMTPKITDYLVMQMLCGPDAENGESVVKNSKGFPAVFLPPTIRNAQDKFTYCQNLGSFRFPPERIFQFPFESINKKTYQGSVDYLIHQARTTALGGKSQNQFADWWKNRTESQVQKAFEEYGKKYDEIVTKMVEIVFRTGRSHLNRGPISNGTMNSAFQEERVYLSMIQELLQPSMQYRLEFENLLEQPPTHGALRNVENQFAILNGLIKKIKVVELEGRKVIHSPLENYELEEQLTNIQSSLRQVSALLGVGDDNQGSIVRLNQQQRNLAVSCLEHLQALATEVMMYGSMANAVSWDKIRNTKRLNMERQQFNNELQAKLAAMRGITMPGKQ